MRLSIVIPALNEEAHIVACIESAEAAGAAEVIVVDGGSSDATLQLAAEHAHLISTPPQRAGQMNAGARLASGDVLLFLHADTTIDPEAGNEISRLLADPGTAGGTFTLQFDDDHPLLRFYSWFTKFKPRIFHYGDQGIFVRTDLFRRMNGFADIPLMEDVEFLARLRREGKCAIAPVPVTTSARRFRKRGIVRQQLLNVVLVAAFYCGVRPQKLAAWYR